MFVATIDIVDYGLLVCYKLVLAYLLAVLVHPVYCLELVLIVESGHLDIIPLLAVPLRRVLNTMILALRIFPVWCHSVTAEGPSISEDYATFLEGAKSLRPNLGYV